MPIVFKNFEELKTTLQEGKAVAYKWWYNDDGTITAIPLAEDGTELE